MQHPPSHPSRSSHKPLTVVRRRRHKGTAAASNAVRWDDEPQAEEEFVRSEVERREQQRLLNRHFSDTNTAAFRHMDRQERWEYVQQLLRKTGVD